MEIYQNIILELIKENNDKIQQKVNENSKVIKDKIGEVLWVINIML